MYNEIRQGKKLKEIITGSTCIEVNNNGKIERKGNKGIYEHNQIVMAYQLSKPNPT